MQPKVSGEQFPDIDAERIGQSLDDKHRGVALAAFDAADVGPVKAVLERELLLAGGGASTVG